VRDAVLRLPPSSGLRQAFTKRVLAFSSYERGDIAGPTELFYSPAIELRGGLAQTAEWYRKALVETG